MYKLTPTVTLRSYITHELLKQPSPFLKEMVFRPAAVKFLLLLEYFFRKGLGQDLLVENMNRELFAFDKSSRKLLTQLLTRKNILSWEYKRQYIDPPYWVCSINIGDIYNKSRQLICTTGHMKAHGASFDRNSALKIALAETIERIAGTEWDDIDLYEASIEQLKKFGKSYFAHSYIQDQSEEDTVKMLKWGVAQSLISKNAIYIPASLLYIFYTGQHTSEPEFIDPSSSGIATQTTREKAIISALYESFERDGLLMYWLTKLSPQKIDLETLPDGKAKTIIAKLQAEGFSVHLLDCKTEFEIPIIVSVTIHDETGRVCVNAAAGKHVPEIVEKVIVDTLRWNTDYKPLHPGIPFEKICTLREREDLWYGGYMREDIEFFISGTSVPFDEYVGQFARYEESEDELDFLKSKLRANGSEAYHYDLTNSLARKTGLKVARVIVPDLIPMYFVEKKPHLNVARIYTFAKKMGYRDALQKKEDLNKVPHPFI